MERVRRTRRALDVFFSNSVRRNAARPALFVGGKSWSYGELDRECRAIEGALRAADVTGTQSNVGVVYGRSAFSYAASIAIMRSNTIYVPLNAKMPAERLLKMIEDAGIETLILDTTEPLSEGVMGALSQSKPLHLILRKPHSGAGLPRAASSGPGHHLWYAFNADGAALDARVTIKASTRSSVVPPGGVPPLAAHLAYIIFTSGSTGIPKGVAVTQESAFRCIEKSHDLFHTCEEDRFTQFSALSFDVSILDLFLCWKSGAALHVPEASEALVPLNFAVNHDITVWSSVPSLANVMRKLRLLKQDVLPQIRLSLFCGEALPCDLAQTWAAAASQSRVFNLYGPTECTVFATYHEYGRQIDSNSGTVPIGVPLKGLRCAVMDDDRAIEADDVPGELWLSGDQLAFGYWNNPVATQAAFVRLPPDDGGGPVWYRTGDLVSRCAGSGLLYRGRLDRQIKLLGHRIELQEIESALRAVIGCTLVAVLPVRDAGGICEKLIAYCDKMSADEGTLKTRCLTRIPRYMVPERILELDTFPFSAHGKIDYVALAQRAAVTQRQ